MSMDIEKLKTDTFDFNLDDEVMLNLCESYEFVEDINEASLSDLISTVEGVGPANARKIKELAHKYMREFSKVDSGSKSSRVLGKKLFSHKPTKQEVIRKKLEEEIAENKKLEEEEKYVLVERPVDKFYTQRIRVKLTPATCDICGFDVVTVNKLPPFEKLSESEQAAVKQTLNEHVNMFHSSTADRKIITATERNKLTNWTEPQTLRP